VESWQWALVLKPLVLFVLCAAVLYPARRAVMRWLPEGKLKRVLLFRWG
jgi:hypothetical protein